MNALDRLNPSAGGSSIADWLVALGIAAVIVLAVALVKPILLRRFAARAERTGKPLDDAVARTIAATQLALVAVLALFMGSEYLSLPARLAHGLDRAATVALFLQVGLWGMALLESWLRRQRARALATDGSAATSLAAIAFIGRLVLWTLVVLLALDNLGINITTLIAGLGIGGIAVALAAQTVLGDLFASLSILTDKPFLIGDTIVAGDLRGTVEQVGLKTTLVRAENGEQVIVPNSDLLKSRIRNLKRMYERRVVLAFGLHYRTTPAQLEQIPALLRRIVESHPRTRFEHAHFMKFGEGSLDFEAIYWITTPDATVHLDTQQAVNLALMREFAKLGVEFAYPTRTIVTEPARV